jgi:carbon storage regulator CsrA
MTPAAQRPQFSVRRPDVLVVSRRADETLVFPSVGITVRVLRVQGKVVRIGIDAPPDMRVLREELVGAPAPAHAPGRSAAHEICNRLSKVSLALHLFERQRAKGLADEAEATLAQALSALATLDQQAVRDLVAADAPPAPPVPRELRALLVEDDTNERELLAGLLRMNGCACATAANGEEALAYLSAHARPDVVLLDMMMPRCDGPTALRAIRTEARLSGLRVFAVSGSSPESLGVPSGPGGLDGWFPKPLDPNRLWNAIRNCGASPN